MSAAASLASSTDRIEVSAVMPCLNEEKTVGICVEKAWRAFRALGIVGEVVVADNGSEDRSVAVAAAAGARIVPVTRRGYGAALSAGIASARGDYVIMADADDSYDWLTMQPFLAALADGHDLVVGNRFQGGIDAGAMPGLHRYFGNPVLSWLARVVHRAPVGDFHCGMRALRRDTFPRLHIRASGMEFATEMIVNASLAGLRIGEIPTRLHRDGRDRQPHLQSFRDGWRHLKFILTYGPNYLYLAPGGACFLLGVAMVAILAAGPVTIGGHYFGIHFLALACALTLAGFNILHYGVLAYVVALRRAPAVDSRLMRWWLSRFSLERALLVGAALMTLGMGCDAWLLLEWVGSGHGPMESTVHAGFIATLAIVIGLNLSLGAFLLNMLLDEARS